MILDPAITSRLRDALRAHDLRMRNWSGPGDWMFAIYADYGESYQGCVRLADDGKLRPDPGRYGLCKRELAVLEGLCKTFHASAPTVPA